MYGLCMADTKGFALPFRVTPGDADIALVGGDALRETHIETVLSARASSADDIGELAWDPERGSALEALRNASASDAVADFAALYAERAMAYALPDERLRAADVTISDRVIELVVRVAKADQPDRNARTVSVATKYSR
jgi:phage gp46-like protein